MDAVLVVAGLFTGAGVAMWAVCKDWEQNQLKELGMVMAILGGIALAVLLFYPTTKTSEDDTPRPNRVKII